MASYRTDILDRNVWHRLVDFIGTALYKARMLTAIKQLFQPAYFTVQLDLTNACNLSCVHCYHPDHSNHGALNSDEWLLVLERIQALARKIGATPKFALCGGEPTLAQPFVAVMRAIKKDFSRSPIIVLTNGTMLDRPLPGNSNTPLTPLSLILECGASTQVSFDGPSAETHDRLRGKGSFEKSVRGVKLLRAQRTEVLLQAVLSRETSPFIPGFFKLAKEMDADAMDFVRLVEEGMAVSYIAKTGAHLVGEDLRAAMVLILQESQQQGIETSTDGPLWALLDESLGSASRLGFYEVIVDYQGFLKISSRTSARLGQVLHDDIWSILSRSPVLRSLRRGEISGCSSCEVFQKGQCSGDRNIAFAASGSFLGADIGCWKWRKENGLDKSEFRAEVETASALHSGTGRSRNLGEDDHVA